MRWLFFIGLIYFIYVTIQYFYLEYVITPERVIIKKGLFYIRTVDIPIYLIEDVLIRQSLYDIMIRGGVIYIFGSSIDTRKLSGMGDPLTFRDALFSQLPATSIGFYEEM